MLRQWVRRILGLLFGAAAVALPCTSSRAGPVQFSLMELGTVQGGGGEVIAVALNNSGQVAGSWNGSFLRAFRTLPNQPLRPGSADWLLDGPEENLGQGLNDRGQVVGTVDAFPFFSFRTAPNAPVNRATDNFVPPGTPQLLPRDINNAGRVVGEILSGGVVDPKRAFRTGPNVAFDPSTDDLGTLGGAFGSAAAINDAGVTVGSSTRADGRSRAFRVPLGRAIDAALDDLGTLGGDDSAAADINAAGQVVGSASTASGATHAFRTAPGAAINPETDDLGVLPGMTTSGASGINARGDVVGTSSAPGANGEPGPSRAFLFLDGVMYDLNDLLEPGTPDVVLTGAVAINDRGQILAGTVFSVGTNGGMSRGAVLLTPSATVVPLPPAFFGGGAGLLGIAAAAVAWRRGSGRKT